MNRRAFFSLLTLPFVKRLMPQSRGYGIMNAPITASIPGDAGGLTYETLASLYGVENQLLSDLPRATWRMRSFEEEPQTKTIEHGWLSDNTMKKHDFGND